MKEEIKFKEMRVKTKPASCPTCGFHPVATILYGYPRFSPTLKKEIEDGEIILGGCCIDDPDLKWECTNCKTFFLEDKKINK